MGKGKEGIFMLILANLVLLDFMLWRIGYMVLTFSFSPT